MESTRRSPKGEQKKKKEKETKNNPPARIYTHQTSSTTQQVKKQNKDLGLSTIDKFVQDQKLQIKEDFIPSAEKSLLSKATLCLSRQMVQIMRRGCHPRFLASLPNKGTIPREKDLFDRHTENPTNTNSG